MATGVNKLSSVIGIASEVTEGTYLAPTAFIQPLSAFSQEPTREELTREIISPEIAIAKPRVGIKGVTGSFPMEMKANGVEGLKPESDLFLESALGGSRAISTRTTTGTGHTSTVIDLDAVTVLKFTVGDFIIILEAGAHHPCFVKSIDLGGGSESITITPPFSGTPSDAVEISKSQTYFPANTGHPHLSITTFWGDEIEERLIGGKVTSFSVENFATGQLGSFNFAVQGMNFDRLDGTSSSPTFTTGLPPVLLGACVNQDDATTFLELNNLGLTLENEVSQLKNVCDLAGVTSQRVTKRTISGSIDPFLDDTTVDQFTKFNTNDDSSFTAIASTPSAVAGEILLGSALGFYLPQVTFTAIPVGDTDNILVENIALKAHGGDDGTKKDLFVGFV